ncbi:metallo-beta-lactamase family protein (plasmid) [Calothrix sp. NIES-4071]|nr:metallo-beta-lactamase family protein [Calothrix sp. NIES-4071]BAZ64467.1 metallo-beta-lactamase family protein [Calothrix sp. NIES-4105]
MYERTWNPRFVGRERTSFIKFISNLNLPKPQKMMEALPANERSVVLMSSSNLPVTGKFWTYIFADSTALSNVVC